MYHIVPCVSPLCHCKPVFVPLLSKTHPGMIHAPIQSLSGLHHGLNARATNKSVCKKSCTAQRKHAQIMCPHHTCKNAVDDSSYSDELIP